MNTTCSLNAPPLRAILMHLSVHGCNRTIHTSSCYRHVTTNVCTKPRIISSTQPMRKSPSKLAKSLNIDVLYPSSQSLPQTSTTALTGSATKSNQCCHLERISIQIDPRLVRAEPALQRFSASECGPREATPKHQTSRMATSWRQSSQPNLRHPQLARPDPHNASACVSASLPSNSRCGFSICLSFTFCFLYSLLYFSLVLAKNRLALSIQRHSL